jgi:hypothetical protein
MAHKEIRKIIVKMETDKYTKVEQRPSMKTNDKGTNNAEHIPNSPKIYCLTIADISNATHFYDKGRNNNLHYIGPTCRLRKHNISRCT